MSEEVARRDVDHDDDEKGQWNRSIASLRSEIFTFLYLAILYTISIQYGSVVSVVTFTVPVR